MLMGHHADSGGGATSGAIEVALDSGIINLLFNGGMVIHLRFSLVF
jgi:hypothetical protein